jgi:2-amino-4-hydroxy-6-hydroxymethyldihydropteridine diphosphokinase
VSSLYRTAPVGHAAQPDFVNAAVAVETALEPRALLAALLAIEAAAGRERTFKDAPRTLDLDILLYGDRTIDEPGLAVPHPRLYERAFALAPLVEIEPEAVVPGRGRAADLLAALENQRVERLA